MDLLKCRAVPAISGPVNSGARVAKTNDRRKHTVPAAGVDLAPAVDCSSTMSDEDSGQVA
jgi:hypothetical protein